MSAPLEHFDAALPDETVMTAVVAGDDSCAFAELVRRWEPRIRSLCLRMTASVQDAEDAMQETFSRAWFCRHQFRGGSAVSTWVWKIAMHAVVDQVRTRRPAKASDLDPARTQLADPATELCAERQEQRQLVAAALQDLPVEVRTIVVLRHYEGLKFREISDVLGVPMGTVCSRMAEGMNRLAVLLKDAV